MWRETYDEVLHASTGNGDACAAQKLLDAVTNVVDIKASDVVAVKAKLNAIGRELVRPLDDVLAVDSKTPRNGVFGTADQDETPSKVRRRSTKKSKKKKSKLMNVRNELRELLDRIALMIDSASPPSIADSEDEPPPFHTFLINVLEKQLGFLLPSVFGAMREAYELTEDDEPVKPPVTLSVVPSKDAPPATDEPVDDSTSILSALKEERPLKKRSLAATSDAFKQVLLPGQLKKTSSTKLAAPIPTRSISSTVEGSRTALKSAKRSTSDSSLMSLAAASKRSMTSRPSNSLLPKAMPMLVRNVDRKILSARSMASSPPGCIPVPSSKGMASSTRTMQTARSGLPSSGQLPRPSVVMRTPDRPQRLQRAQPRILVEASPPLRNPFATARLRRPGPQLPK